MSLRREELIYRGFFTPLKSASTLQEALLAAEAIMRSDEFGGSDFLKIGLVEALLGSIGKANDWSDFSPLRAARILSLACQHCCDVHSVLLLTDQILTFPGFQGDKPADAELRELHASILVENESLAINTREATELANRIGKPSHFQRSEALQLKIGRLLLTAACVEDRPEILEKIRLLFDNLPSMADNQKLLELQAQVSSLAGSQIREREERLAQRVSKRAHWGQSLAVALSGANTIQALRCYADSKVLQLAQAQALLDGLQFDRVGMGAWELEDSFRLLFSNPIFWQEPALQAQYLSLSTEFLARFGFTDGLAAGRHFDSDVLYGGSYQLEETEERKVVNRYLAVYRQDRRALA